MLNAKALKELKKGVSFKDDITIIHTLIDWLKLVIRTGWIPKNLYQKASALRFLFNKGSQTNTKSTPIPQ